MDEIREKIFWAFNGSGEYSHVLPFQRTGYIDGLFHLSMLAGAAHMADDKEMEEKAVIWINKLLLNPGYRSWVSAYYGVCPTEEKEQSFAGPCALQWAIDRGCALFSAPWSIASKARVLRMVSPLVLYGYKYVSALRQHVNSCMLAHLLDGSRPWCASDLLVNNPFYSYICGKRCVPFEAVPILKPWGSAWLWKQIPVQWTESEGEDLTFEYTPVALYVAGVLQAKLEE